jgi:hypothetical protein
MQGADTSIIVDSALITRAAKRIGGNPQFWGRYFKGPGDPNPAQYQPHKENAVFSAAGIPILPIARQTTHVGGSEAAGATDARNNIAAINAAFGGTVLAARPVPLLVFLDVEPSHPLSAAYYTGWSREIAASSSKLAPAVYLNQSDTTTWKAIKDCIDKNSKCAGVWVAHYFVSKGCWPVPAWNAADVEPKGIKVAVPIFAWQFCGDCDEVDYSLINSSLANDLRAGLILPEKFEFDDLAFENARQRDTGHDLANLIQLTLSAVAEQHRSQNGADQKPYLFPNGINDIELELNMGDGIGAKLTIKGAPEAGSPPRSVQNGLTNVC